MNNGKNADEVVQTIIPETKTLVELINDETVQKKFRDIIGHNPMPFLTTLLELVNQPGLLQKADPNSILTAAAVCASLDLPINPELGMAFIVGYQDPRRKLKVFAQFQIGWKGLVELCHRSGLFVRINPTDVREGEFGGIDRLTGDITLTSNQDNDKRAQLPIIGFTGYFRLTNGFEKALWMTELELENHAKQYSDEYRLKGTGMWKTKNFEMKMKTLVKLLLDRWAPKSIHTKHLQLAIRADQSVIGDFEAETVHYIDNQQKKPLDLEAHNATKEREGIIAFIESCTTLEMLETCYEKVPDLEIGKLYNTKKQAIIESLK